MKSRASFSSHPIHPILVAFPIGFFTGTLVFDLLAWFTNDHGYATTAFYMEISGIIGAVLAAAAGIIDYIYTVPTQSSAKKRATKHGLVNSTMLVFFVVAFILRQNMDLPSTGVLVLEVAGVALMLVGGYLGGTLVYRNLIGVDMRYANAGKWKEIYIDATTGKVEIEGAINLKPNQMILVHAKQKRIVVARSDDGFVAFSDHCTHRGGSLAGGQMICGTVQCPWHGSQFDVTTGEVKAGPADQSIKTFKLEASPKAILLDMDAL